MAGDASPIADAQLDDLESGLDRILRARPRQPQENEALWAEWQRTVAYASGLKQALGKHTERVALSYSDRLGFPSLIQMDEIAGGCLKVGAQDRVTILTSATLSDMDHAPGEEPNFHFMRSRLFLKHGDGRIGLRRSHQPLEFGHLAFSLPEFHSHPFRKVEGDYQLSEAYLRHAVNTILSGPEGRTLVLCVSYQDVEGLQSFWPASKLPRLVAPGPGVALNEVAEAMPPDGVLITPAGWEGLSPRRLGSSAFWGHLVLLRNPNPRPDPVAELVRTQRFLETETRAFAQRKAKAITQSQNTVRTIHRIRQGIGRAIRHPEDQVTITILDPRFPRPYVQRDSGYRVNNRLRGAIPFRFQQAYERAMGTEQPAVVL